MSYFWPFLLLVLSLGAQEPFSAHLSAPESVALDQLLKVTLSLRYPDTFRPDLAALTASLARYPSLEEAPFTLEGIEETNGRPHELLLLFEPQRVGQFYLALGEITFTSGHESKTLLAELIPIQVVPADIAQEPHLLPAPLLPLTTPFPTTLSPTNQKRLDALEKQPQAASNLFYYWSKQPPWTGLAFLLSALLCLAIARQYPVASFKKKEPSPAEIRVPIEEALALFSAEREPSAAAYSQLASNLRRYLELKWAIPAAALTTEECLRRAAEKNRELFQVVKEPMEWADRALFARQLPRESQVRAIAASLTRILSLP